MRPVTSGWGEFGPMTMSFRPLPEGNGDGRDDAMRGREKVFG